VWKKVREAIQTSDTTSFTQQRDADDIMEREDKRSVGVIAGIQAEMRGNYHWLCRQLIIAHPQPTFNYTGIQSVMQAADTLLPVSVIAPEKDENITVILWRHNTETQSC